MVPSITYMICATLRSGSSLLDEAMMRTAIAGCPNEFFWTGHEATLSKRWGTSNYREFLDAAIQTGSTENGVFGFKTLVELGAALQYEHSGKKITYRVLFPAAR